MYLHCKSILYVYCVICTNYSQRNIVLSMQEHLCLVLEELNKRWAHQFKVFSEKIESDPRFSRFWKINVASHQMDLRHRNFYEERKSRTSTISSQCYIMICHLNIVREISYYVVPPSKILMVH